MRSCAARGCRRPVSSRSTSRRAEREATARSGARQDRLIEGRFEQLTRFVRAACNTWRYEEVWICPRGCFATLEGLCACARACHNQFVEVVPANRAAREHALGQQNHPDRRTVARALIETFARRDLCVCPHGCRLDDDDRHGCGRCGAWLEPVPFNRARELLSWWLDQRALKRAANSSALEHSA